jgi:hypothetical protein
MRLSDEQVKELLLHDDRQVRTFALDYFANSYSPDPTVMPCVIEQINRRGFKGLFDRWHSAGLAHLQQSPETIQWAMETLESNKSTQEGECQPSDDLTQVNCAWRVINAADATLTYPYRKRLDNLLRKTNRGFLRELTDRWDLIDSSFENLWDELNRKVRKARRAGKWVKSVRYVEALSRHREAMVSHVLDTLRASVENIDFKSYEYAMSAFLVEIAGLSRMTEATELIARTFEYDGEIDNEVANLALIRIGTPAAVAAVKEQILIGFEAARWYGPSVLGNIHSDEAIAAGLDLLSRRYDDAPIVCEGLFHSLLAQPSYDVLEAVYQHLSETEGDDFFEAKLACVVLSRVLDRDFPKLASWVAEAENLALPKVPLLDRVADILQHMMDPSIIKVRNPTLLEQDPNVIDIAPRRDVAGIPNETNNWPVGDNDEFAEDYSPTPEDDLPATDYEHPHQVHVAHQPGRNEPCPCGSGKKFKKCCLGKSVV